MAPTPDPDVLDAQAVARAATPRSTSIMISPGGGPTPPFGGFFVRRNGKTNGGNGNGNGSTNGSNIGSDTNHGAATAADAAVAAAAAVTPDGNSGRTRGAPPPVAPYKPATMEVFTCVIWILLLVGATACACVFPYQGLREEAGDRHRWEVTLARWSASRDFPSYGPLTEFYPRAASSGIDRYLLPGVPSLPGDPEPGEIYQIPPRAP